MLASNESPYPPIPEVIAAASAALAGVNRYPDPTNARCAARWPTASACPPERIAVGNGSCDILLAAGEALLEPGAELIHAWPSFSVYPQLEAASGARAIRVAAGRAGAPRPRRDGGRGDGGDAARDRLQPEQPDEHGAPARADRRVRRGVPPHVCVLLDEAYCEFNLLDDPDASLDLLERHPNLVLLRTFSKIYGLCGLRVGYALCGSRELPDALAQIRQPFFCNAAAQAAAVEALRHQDEVARRVERVAVARVQIEDGLRELGIEPAASQANFCWFDLGEGRDEDEIVEGLAEPACWSARAARSASRARCGSPTGRRSRTSGSSRCSARSSANAAFARRVRVGIYCLGRWLQTTPLRLFGTSASLQRLTRRPRGSRRRCPRSTASTQRSPSSSPGSWDRCGAHTSSPSSRFLGLGTALKPGGEGIIAWIAQTFLQLVLLSVIMVGQAVQSAASDARSEQTYEDTLKILDALDVHTEGGIKDLHDELLAAIAKIPTR